MKKVILIILIFSGVLFAQKSYLTLGNSILVKNPYSTTYTLIAISDSSNSLTDTLVAEVYWGSFMGWLPVAVQDLETHDDWYSTIIPGDGEAKIYLINYLKLKDNFRIRKTNVGAAINESTKVEIGGLQ